LSWINLDGSATAASGGDGARGSGPARGRRARLPPAAGAVEGGAEQGRRAREGKGGESRRAGGAEQRRRARGERKRGGRGEKTDVWVPFFGSRYRG